MIKKMLAGIVIMLVIAMGVYAQSGPYGSETVGASKNSKNADKFKPISDDSSRDYNKVVENYGGYHIDSELEIRGSEDGSVGVVAENGIITKVEVTPAEAISKSVGTEAKEVEIRLEEKEYNNVPAVVYKVNGEHEGKFLGIFKISTRYQAAVDAQTGDVLEWSGPWWAFLITGEPEEPIVKEKVAPTDPVGVID